MTPKFHATVEGRIKTILPTIYPLYPVFFGNTNIPDNSTTYYVVNVLSSADTDQINFGTLSKSRNVGLVQIDALTKTGIGAGLAQDMAWGVSKILYRSQLEVLGEGWITFKDPTGPVDMGTKESHREIIRIPYRYDFVLP